MKKISHIFRKAVLLTTLGISLGIYMGQRGEPLTPGEAGLAQGVFGAQVDTSIVRKHFYPDYGNNSAGTLSGKWMEFYGVDNISADYSQDSAISNFSNFMHEMMHIVQFQQGAKPNCKKYTYTLTGQSRFADFCTEQQAVIIEDYTGRFLYPAYKGWAFHNEKLSNTPESDLLLQRVVENQFPAARKTRLAVEAQRNVASAPSPQKRAPG